jgi:hypothetical protein
MGPGTAKTSGDGTTPPPYRVGVEGENVGWATESAKVEKGEGTAKRQPGD